MEGGSMTAAMRSTLRHRAHCAGITLVEVLVTIAIFVIGVVALAQVAVVSSQLRRAQMEKRSAWTALAEELRTIESTPFAEIVARHDGRGFDVVLEGAMSAMLRPLPDDSDGRPGTIEITTPEPPGDSAVLLDVTVRLEWKGSFAPQRLVRTLRISRPGASS